MPAQDYFFLSLLAGIIAIAVREAYSLLAHALGIGTHLIWQVAADIFVKPDQTHTILGTILGLITDTTVGAMLGVLFGFYIKITGIKYYLLKGWGIGLAAWLILFGLIQHTLPHTSTLAPTDALSNISAFVGHSIFGLTMALSYIFFLKAQSATNSLPIKRKQAVKYSLFSWILKNSNDFIKKKTSHAKRYILKRRLK